MLNPRGLTPIGLDFGARWVKAVQLRLRAGAWQVVAASRFPRAVGGAAGELGQMRAEEVNRIGAVLARQGFIGSEVVLAVPAGQQVAATVQLPAVDSPAPVDQIVLAQLSEAARISPEQITATWWEGPLGKQGERTGLAIGAKRKELEGFLDVVEAGGLVPVAMDARGCAIGRACNRLLLPAPALTAIIDIGDAEALLVVMNQGKPVYERSLTESGMGALLRILMRELEIELDLAQYILARIGLGPPPQRGEGNDGGGGGGGSEASVWELVEDAHEIIAEHVATLAREVQLSVSYAAGSAGAESATHVLLTGGGAAMPGMAPRLSQTLSARVQTVGLSDVAQTPVGLDADTGGPAMVTAAGMAMNDPRSRAVEVR